MAHAFLSPSSFPRIAKCPASLLASLHAPRRAAGCAADEGTRLHAIAERHLLDHSIIRPPIIREEDEMIRPYVEYCMRQIDVSNRYGIEDRVSLDGFAPIAGQFGTLDFWALVEDTLMVTDLKTGQHRVSPDSEQLLAYAGGLMTSELALVSERIKTVVLTIVQQNHIEHHTMTIEEFWRELKGLSNILLQALSPSPTFAPSEEACKYCPAAAICTARAKMFDGLEVLDQASVEHLQPLEKAERILSWKPRVTKYFDQIEATLLAAAQSGTELTFFELGKTKPHRAWSTLNGLDFQWKAKQAGIADIDSLMVPISPSKAEQVLGKKLFKQMLEPLVFQPAGEVKLVAKVFGDKP